jgi:hypothetical protein
MCLSGLGWLHKACKRSNGGEQTGYPFAVYLVVTCTWYSPEHPNPTMP